MLGVFFLGFFNKEVSKRFQITSTLCFFCSKGRRGLKPRRPLGEIKRILFQCPYFPSCQLRCPIFTKQSQSIKVLIWEKHFCHNGFAII